MLSPRIIQGKMGGHGLDVVCGHIEAFGLFPFPHQRKTCAEGLQGRHALSMLGRTLQHNHVAVSTSVATEGGPADNENFCKLWKVYCT